MARFGKAPCPNGTGTTSCGRSSSLARSTSTTTPSLWPGGSWTLMGPGRSIHLTFFGSCPDTIAHILGEPHPTNPSDPLLSNLRPRVSKSLLQFDFPCSCLPKETLVCGPTPLCTRAKLLAEESLADGISLEKASPWPGDLPTETCHLTAQFHGCCDFLGNGSAGLAIFLETGLRPCEIFHCRVCLESQCTLHTATYQACGFILSSLSLPPLHCMNYSRGPQIWVRVSTIIPLHHYCAYSLVLSFLAP